LEAAARALGTGGAGATPLLALLHGSDVEVKLLLVKAAPERMAAVNVIENLGMVSVAEGVEEPGELATLQSPGCRYSQGWLFGRPMAPDLLLPSRLAG